MSSIIRFPTHTETHYAVVGITASRLESPLDVEIPNQLLKTITHSTASILYFESMIPEVQLLPGSIS